MKKTKLKIHTWPDKILKKKCKRVKSVDDRVRALLDEMLLLMNAGEGIGLAANQAGIDLSLVVVQVKGRIFKLVNPQITKKRGRLEFREGCLSFPGLELTVRRAKSIWVSALDEKGRIRDYQAEGPLAVVFQHEIDHLNGTLFIERVSLWQRLKNFTRLNEIKKKNKER